MQLITNPFLEDGYNLRPRPLSAKEILSNLAPDAPVGVYLQQEFTKWIKDRTPVDSFGYPWLSPDSVEAWRRAKAGQLGSALHRLQDCRSLMED